MIGTILHNVDLIPLLFSLFLSIFLSLCLLSVSTFLVLVWLLSKWKKHLKMNAYSFQVLVSEVILSQKWLWLFSVICVVSTQICWRESYPAGYAATVPVVGNPDSNKVLVCLSGCHSNPAFLSEAPSTHKLTGHAHGPDKLYRFATFLLASKGWCWDQIAKHRRMLHQDNCDGEEWPPLAEGIALPSLLESDHGVVGPGIWNNSTLGVKKKDRPQGNKNFTI